MVFNPSKRNSPIHRIERFRGINLSTDATQISFNESPDLKNIVIDKDGIPNKRSGYKRVNTTSLGAGKINGLHSFRKTDGSLVRIAHHGTKLYTWNDAGAFVEIYAGLNNANSNAFTMNGVFYLFDRVNYIQYDGTTVQAVSPYIPTTRISSAPNGTGGVSNEQHNLIGAGFENWFSGDNTSTIYTMTIGTLDATSIVASIDGGVNYDKVETTHFTVNRTTGVVTWITAPPTGTNNVRIRAFRTVAGNADKIKQSSGHHLFGGTNDTRVWVWNKHRLYRSDTLRPNYFPENFFQAIGSESEYIMGMVTQYGAAVVVKTYSRYFIEPSDDGTTITYPVKQVNDAIGCQAASSIEIINNNITSLSDTGVYEMVGSNVRDERNVSLQSKRINARLLSEANLVNAVSVDWGNLYILSINSNAYVWDYEQPAVDEKGEWYYWTNIPAACFYQEGTNLYMGSNASGMIYRFTTSADIVDQYADDGVAIDARWKTKVEYLGTTEQMKTVKTIWVSLQTYLRTSAEIWYYDEENVPTLLDAVELNMSLFSYETFSYNYISYITSKLPRTARFKSKIKKIQTFQLEIRNNKLNERLGILSTQWEYEYKSKFK